MRGYTPLVRRRLLHGASLTKWWTSHPGSLFHTLVRSKQVCIVRASEQNEIMYSRICSGSCAIVLIAHVLRCFAYYTSAIVLGLYDIFATELAVAGHWWMRTGAG